MRLAFASEELSELLGQRSEVTPRARVRVQLNKRLRRSGVRYVRLVHMLTGVGVVVGKPRLARSRRHAYERRVPDHLDPVPVLGVGLQLW